MDANLATGVSLKPVKAILADWELTQHLINQDASRSLADDLNNNNPYTIFATLAMLFDDDRYSVGNLTDADRVRLHGIFRELYVRTARKEGAI